jgi:hypothetical protein
MNTNYHQIVKMSKEEQIEMYKNVPLGKLIEMLIECNRLLDMYTIPIVSYSTTDVELLTNDILIEGNNIGINFKLPKGTLCTSKNCNQLAVADYNGHGDYGCEYHLRKWDEEFDNDY